MGIRLFEYADDSFIHSHPRTSPRCTCLGSLSLRQSAQHPRKLLSHRVLLHRTVLRRHLGAVRKMNEAIRSRVSLLRLYDDPIWTEADRVRYHECSQSRTLSFRRIPSETYLVDERGDSIDWPARRQSQSGYDTITQESAPTLAVNDQVQVVLGLEVCQLG